MHFGQGVVYVGATSCSARLNSVCLYRTFDQILACTTFAIVASLALVLVVKEVMAVFCFEPTFLTSPAFYGFLETAVAC